jgi:hypothetical protein
MMCHSALFAQCRYDIIEYIDITSDLLQFTSWLIVYLHSLPCRENRETRATG